MTNIAILVSTNGSVFQAAYSRSRTLQQHVQLVISDRPCGAVDAAKRLGIKTSIIPWVGRDAFSTCLAELLRSHNIGLCASFFTRLLCGALISEYQGRLVNFHPSILPSFPGMKGFEDSIAVPGRFIGSTVHLIDSHIDTGAPVIQACLPRDPAFTPQQLRHQVFLQQCRCLIQVAEWYTEQRVIYDGIGVSIMGAHYPPGIYSPALESRDALNLRVQDPAGDTTCAQQ